MQQSLANGASDCQNTFHCQAERWTATGGQRMLLTAPGGSNSCRWSHRAKRITCRSRS